MAQHYGHPFLGPYNPNHQVRTALRRAVAGGLRRIQPTYGSYAPVPTYNPFAMQQPASHANQVVPAAWPVRGLVVIARLPHSRDPPSRSVRESGRA